MYFKMYTQKQNTLTNVDPLYSLLFGNVQVFRSRVTAKLDYLTWRTLIKIKIKRYRIKNNKFDHITIIIVTGK